MDAAVQESREKPRWSKNQSTASSDWNTGEMLHADPEILPNCEFPEERAGLSRGMDISTCVWAASSDLHGPAWQSTIYAEIIHEPSTASRSNPD